MSKSYSKKRGIQVSQIIAGIASFMIFTYFAYHLAYGDMGYFSMRKVEVQLNEAKVEYKQLKKDREGLENRVKRMRPDSLDLDVLDERSRDVLGYAKKNEVVLVEE